MRRKSFSETWIFDVFVTGFKGSADGLALKYNNLYVRSPIFVLNHLVYLIIFLFTVVAYLLLYVPTRFVVALLPVFWFLQFVSSLPQYDGFLPSGETLLEAFGSRQVAFVLLEKV
ncbi:hypothetical protein GCK72_023642 [Caenorhabditis remanei]|uniref:Uncharacterized protein n=1 Tax=Caenorhabditis remanei TaxID=31234 RepID=A0A6A5FXR2_CAERE|nr:hypothetical protein GCK72_023642 [Caenorhabditis remanei]KAF1747181.1 hypothetical protein GCK72_023642 [Caenorhabditis remanei]